MSLQMTLLRNNYKSNMKICDPEHDAEVVENIVSFFVRREYLDLVFICKRNVQIHCHKMIFASVSELLANIMNKSGDDIICISLPDIEYKQLQILVNFLYEGITKLNLDELLAVREVAGFLGISLDHVEVENVADGLVKKERLENEKFVIPLVEKKVPLENISNEKEKTSLYQNTNNDPENKITPVKKRGRGRPPWKFRAADTVSPQQQSESKPSTPKTKTPSRSLKIDSPQPSYSSDPLSNDEPVPSEASSFEARNPTDSTPAVKLETPSDSDDDSTRDNEVSFFEPMDQTPPADESNLEDENVKRTSQSFEQVPKKTESPQCASTGVKKRGRGRPPWKFRAADTVSSQSTEVTTPRLKSDNLEKKNPLLSSTIDCRQPSYSSDPLSNDEPVPSEASSSEARNPTNSAPAMKLETPSDSDDDDSARDNEVSFFEPMDQSPHADESNLEDENVQRSSESSEQISNKTVSPHKGKFPHIRAALEDTAPTHSPSPAEDLAAVNASSSVDPTTMKAPSECPMERVSIKTEPEDQFVNPWECNVIISDVSSNQPDGGATTDSNVATETDNAVLQKRIKTEPSEEYPSTPGNAVSNFSKSSKFNSQFKTTLEAVYADEKFPSKEVREKLARDLGVPFQTVTYWFINKRKNDPTDFATPKLPAPRGLKDSQRDMLESFYRNEGVSSKESREKFAAQLGITEEKLRGWLRTRQRKDVPEFLRSMQNLTQKQKMILESKFRINKFPNKNICARLAQEVGISINTVMFWFMRRRKKQGSTPLPKPPRYKDWMTRQQRSILEETYRTKGIPDKKDREQLANELQLPSLKLKEWFIRRRNRDAPDRPDMTERPKLTKRISDDEKVVFEALYNAGGYPSEEIQVELAHKYGISYDRIRHWFMNRRSRDRLGIPETLEYEKSSCSRMTDEERKVLEETYAVDRFPSNRVRLELAEKLGVSTDRVRYWFYSRRIKDQEEFGLPSKVPQFTPEQCSILEAAFNIENNPEEESLVGLAEDVELNLEFVKFWFRRRNEGQMFPDMQMQRHVYPDWQRNILESYYEQEKYPSRELYEKIAQELQIQFSRVKSWFANRRSNDEDVSALQRSAFPDWQKRKLEKHYNEVKYPLRETMEAIAEELQTSFERVRMWFLNRRRKDDDLASVQHPSRSSFPDWQKQILEQVYSEEKYPQREALEKLAQDFQTSFERIRGWFKTMRRKDEDVPTRPQGAYMHYTEEQKNILQKFYNEGQHLYAKEMLQKIAEETQLPLERVRNWIANKRASEAISFSRSVYSVEQSNALEEYYTIKRYPQREDVDELCAKLDLSFDRVKSWFKKRRMKDPTIACEGSLPRGPPPRAQITAEQKDVLEQCYFIDKYPDKETMVRLAEDLQLPFDRVRTWFREKRKQDPENPTQQKHFTEEQRKILEEHYSDNIHPDMEVRAMLAEKLQTTYDKVTSWFINKRKRDPSASATPNPNRFTDQQRESLEQFYASNPNVHKGDMEKIAEELGVTFVRVKSWFHTRKSKDRPEASQSRRGYFTEEQKMILEEAYSKEKYPDAETRGKLADEMQVTYDRVCGWFANRRRKDPDCDSMFRPVGSRLTIPAIEKFTDEQKAFLENFYINEGYPSKKKMEELAQELGVPNNRLRSWFYNRKLETRPENTSTRYKLRNKRAMSMGEESEDDDYEDDWEDEESTNQSVGSACKRRKIKTETEDSMSVQDFGQNSRSSLDTVSDEFMAGTPNSQTGNIKMETSDTFLMSENACDDEYFDYDDVDEDEFDD